MKLNERLNLVIPLYRDGDDPYAWVHATPISREVFESNYLLLSKTFTAIHTEGLGEVAGPKVAALILRDIGKQMAGAGGDGETVIRPLLNEIRRLSNVIVPGPNGWEMRPLQDAIVPKLLDEDDLHEVENGLVFFTVVSPMYPKQSRQDFLDGAARLWGARMLSSNSTEFRDSLRTSTETASSGATVTTSSVPS